jgi:predicted transcriptional regulator
MRSTIIFSIQPKHAAKIFSGAKRVELRRTRPKDLDKGGLALIYVTSPNRCLAGAFKVTRIIERPLGELWRTVRKKAGITYREFKQYYGGVSTGTGIFFQKVWSFPEPLTLQDLRDELSSFLPPQAFRYARVHELSAPRVAKLLSNVG